MLKYLKPYHIKLRNQQYLEAVAIGLNALKCAQTWFCGWVRWAHMGGPRGHHIYLAPCWAARQAAAAASCPGRIAPFFPFSLIFGCKNFLQDFFPEFFFSFGCKSFTNFFLLNFFGFRMQQIFLQFFSQNFLFQTVILIKVFPFSSKYFS